MKNFLNEQYKTFEKDLQFIWNYLKNPQIWEKLNPNDKEIVWKSIRQRDLCETLARITISNFSEEGKINKTQIKEYLSNTKKIFLLIYL